MRLFGHDVSGLRGALVPLAQSTPVRVVVDGEDRADARYGMVGGVFVIEAGEAPKPAKAKAKKGK